MASVVLGIVNGPERFPDPIGTAAAGCAVAGGWGTAALAACSLTSRETSITDTTGNNRMIQRIFMNPSISSTWRNHTVGGRIPSLTARYDIAQCYVQGNPISGN